MKSGQIVVQESMSFSNMTITKQRLAVETFQTAKLSLKRRTVVFTVAKGLPELATTLEKLNCFHSEH